MSDHEFLEGVPEWFSDPSPVTITGTMTHLPAGTFGGHFEMTSLQEQNRLQSPARHLVKETGPIRHFLDTYSDRTEADDSGILAIFFSVLAAHIGMNLKIEYGTQTLRCNLYVSLFGNSGSKKSTLLDIARYYLTQPECSEYVSAIADNFTPEALVKHYELHPNVWLRSDELSKLHELGNKPYAGDAGQILTEVYGGYVSPGMRMANAQENLQGLNVCQHILGASTEEWMNTRSLSEIRTGEFARYIPFMLPSSGKEIPFPVKPESAMVAVNHNFFRKVRRLAVGTVAFSDTALELYGERYHEFKADVRQREAKQDPLSDVIGSIGARMFPNAVKVATLLQVADNIMLPADQQEDPTVSGDNMRRALDFIRDIMSMYEMKLEEGLFRGAEKRAETKILAFVKANPRATLVELRDLTGLESRQTEQVLKTMIRSGLVKMIEEEGVEFYRPGRLS